MDVDELTDDFLAHYGKKGMKWGQRKQPTSVTITQKVGSKNLKAKGGKNQKAHDDAVGAAMSRQIARKSGTNALSNKELQALVTRMNLEQQYVRLSSPQKKQGKSFVDEAISNAPKLINVAKSVSGSKGK